MTFLVTAGAVALIFDMVRRIRRVRYRAEIAEKLEAEAQAANATKPAAAKVKPAAAKAKPVAKAKPERPAPPAKPKR